MKTPFKVVVLLILIIVDIYINFVIIDWIHFYYPNIKEFDLFIALLLTLLTLF